MLFGRKPPTPPAVPPVHAVTITIVIPIQTSTGAQSEPFTITLTISLPTREEMIAILKPWLVMGGLWIGFSTTDQIALLCPTNPAPRTTPVELAQPEPKAPSSKTDAYNNTPDKKLPFISPAS